ncbi:MAG: RNA polymerase sigma factor [Gemmataceae bacterium]
MTHDWSDEQCLELWRSGNEEAARELFDRYVEKLLHLVSQRINHRILGRVDAEDVVQSVFGTFFKRVRAGELQATNPDDVGKLLFRIALRKTFRQITFHQQGKRDARLESGTSDESQFLDSLALSREPTPEEASLLLDQADHFLSQLEPTDRRICELRLEGYNNAEIAQKLEISDRRIRRLLERLRCVANEDIDG